MITVEHLTKCYGDFTAIHDLSFEIGEGCVYGFLGPNGAGKSTTMNIITGCLSATEGTVTIDGHDIFEEPDAAKKLIGYLPEQPPLYMNDSVLEYLRFVGEAKGLKKPELSDQIDEVISQTKLEDVRNKRISSLSKGYRQRVGIAQAILGNPKVIILDEPTVGLDPIQLTEIRELIKDLGKDHTVIFSSHILSEVQAICDEVLIIAGGRLLAFDKTENLEKLRFGAGEITLTAEAGEDETRQILSSIEDIGIKEITANEENISTARITTEHEDIYEISRAVFFAFADRRRALLEISLKRSNLEDIFLQLTENAESREITGDTAEETKEDAEVISEMPAAGDMAKENGEVKQS